MTNIIDVLDKLQKPTFCLHLWFLVVKQPLAAGIRGVQVLSQASVFDAQKNNLKEAAGGTFRFVVFICLSKANILWYCLYVHPNLCWLTICHPVHNF